MQVTVNYGTSGIRKLPVLPEFTALVKAIGHMQTPKYGHLAQVILSTVDLKEAVFNQCCLQVTDELQQLCSTNQYSILQKKSKNDLLNFSWDAVYDEFEERCPKFLHFLKQATTNPSAHTNKVKNTSQIKMAMCSAGCKLISIFNDDMSALRHINSILAKKGGLKKIGFIRLCATYDTMSYLTTSRMLDCFAENHDDVLLGWKKAIETDSILEKEVLKSIQGGTATASQQQILAELREQMHPGKLHIFRSPNFHQPIYCDQVVPYAFIILVTFIESSTYFKYYLEVLV